MRDRQLDLEEVHDLFAYRIVVPDESACYLALASIHEIFDPEPFRFKDYVAEPKANGYRSLHTSVRDEAGRVFEVQIRSVGMHDEAEDGHAAHWRYRADRWNGLDDLSPRRPMGWLRRLSPG
jgi:GTP pyrophosphokinase